MSEDNQTSETEEVESVETFNLSQFITPQKEVKERSKDDNETVKAQTDDVIKHEINDSSLEIPHEIPPKAGQKYWLSSEAKKKKNEYMRTRYIQKKEALQHLREHQIHPRDIKIFNVNGKVLVRHLETEADYVRMIDDAFGTLVDNCLLTNYEWVSQ